MHHQWIAPITNGQRHEYNKSDREKFREQEWGKCRTERNLEVKLSNDARSPNRILTEGFEEFLSHGRREFSDQTQCGYHSKQKIVRKYNVKISKPIKSSEITQEIKPCYSCRRKDTGNLWETQEGFSDSIYFTVLYNLFPINQQM